MSENNCTANFCANLGKIGCDNAQCQFMKAGNNSHCMSPEHPPKPRQSDKLLAAYFANWGQYHNYPYGPHRPRELAAVMPQLDVLFYAFAKFDTDTFQLVDVEPKDKEFQEEIVEMRKEFNPKMKFVISIGGWSFPSHSFSVMVSNATSRKAFINSSIQFMTSRGFDGIDIDWEYPCSDARVDYVELNCSDAGFIPHKDAGGNVKNCKADADGYLALVQELREALGKDSWITVASQAAYERSSQWRLKEMAQYIDYYNIMTYDYVVSATATSNSTGPNSPLHKSSSLSGDIGNQSVAQTITDYLTAGVKANQLMMGVALYAHTWWTPDAISKGEKWQTFGIPAQIQGKCCGPDKKTYGAKFGAGSKQCGSLMLSEIEGNQLQVYHDEETQSMIALNADGVWMSYDDETTVGKKIDFAKAQGLAGVFAFDSSMDKGAMSGDYTVMNVMRSHLDAKDISLVV